ncbi:MAG: class I SAM-dependent methyltransferase [Planctomycetota bacterium]
MTAATVPIPSASDRAPARDTPARREPRGGGRWYVRRQMRRAVCRAIEQHLAGGRDAALVDLGCGDTPYRGLIEPRVGAYVGVDLPENRRADLALSAAGRTPLADGAADAVLSTQVLEHVPDPAAYLREARRLLKPGGTLILSTHGHWKFHPHPGDYWRWTSQGLRHAVERAGFEVTECVGVLGLGAAGAVMLQDAVVSRLPRRLRWPIATCGQALCAAADRLHAAAARDRDAAVYFIAARPTSARSADQHE